MARHRLLVMRAVLIHTCTRHLFRVLALMGGAFYRMNLGNGTFRIRRQPKERLLLKAVEEIYCQTWPGQEVAPSPADVEEVVETYRSLRRKVLFSKLTT